MVGGIVVYVMWGEFEDEEEERPEDASEEEFNHMPRIASMDRLKLQRHYGTV